MSREDIPWIKSSTSNDAEDCVEMRRVGANIEVRDTKNGEQGAVLRFTPAEWDAWLDGAKKGEFDHLM
jgi:hypothetical protein